MDKASAPKTSVCVAYGLEDYQLDSVIQMAQSWRNRDTRYLNGEGKSDSDVLHLLRGPNCDDLPVTVIVDNAQDVKESKGKALRTFIEGRSATDTSAVLVAVVRSSKLDELWDFISRKSKPLHYPKLKNFGEGKSNEVLKYIRERAIKFGLSFDADADIAFYRATGGDLYNINNEFRKLAVLSTVTKSQKITKQLIGKVVALNTVADPWSVAEAAFSKNKKEAMRLLSHLYESEPESASVRICAALIKELQSVIVARGLLDDGVSPDDISSLLEMHPWKCKEIFLPRVEKHSVKSLTGVMSRLCKLDSDVKSAARSKRTLVELAVLSITA
jgi:DNA polymerase III delta subunit